MRFISKIMKCVIPQELSTLLELIPRETHNNFHLPNLETFQSLQPKLQIWKNAQDLMKNRMSH